MPYFLAGVFVLVALFVLGRAFVTTDVRAVVRFLRYFVGIFLILVGAVLILAERWGLGLPAIATGISAIAVGRIGPIDLGGAYRSGGQRSGVRSRWLEMSLDHDSGAMTGTVREGTHAGKNLDDLDEEALMRILTEPKNALVRQYQRLFEMEDVQLTFADEALRTISKKAIERKTGARGLRSIMEGILLDTMFELPSLRGVEEVVISSEVVEGKARPLRIYSDRHEELGTSA